MQSLAANVQHLERRRATLAHELERIDRQLKVISSAMTAASEDSKGAGRARGRRVRGAGSTKRQRRSWFEREEAARLMKKAAKSPIAQADLVRELAKLKGYAGKLEADEMRLFEGAAFMAVANALKSKVLRRAAGGKVVAA